MEQSTDCELLGPLGIIVQTAITGVCALALVAVWLMEFPRRRFVTWVFDTSKQVAGNAYGKVYNIVQAEVFARFLRNDSEHRDQCVWYLMGIATDCFLTTFLCYCASIFLRPVLLSRFGIDVGEYSCEAQVPVISSPCHDTSPFVNKFSTLGLSSARPVRTWLLQVLIWLLIITAVRLVVSAFLFLTQESLYTVYASFFIILGLQYPAEKMIFAVLAFPAIGDTFQIVVQDRFLKKLPTVGATFETPLLAS